MMALAAASLVMAHGALAQALPEPRRSDGHSLEQALAERRSVRQFATAPLKLEELGQLAWAAQGVTGQGHRTVPSAGGLYPIELNVVVGNVVGLAPGVYRYTPDEHRLERVADEDRRTKLAAAAFGQSWMAEAPAIFVIAGVERRTTTKYGERGVRYVHMEAGHAGENVLLQATALGLGATVVGAFDDERVKIVTGLPAAARPLSLVPVGRPR